MIYEKVQSIIATQLEINEDRIKMESAIKEDLGADSLAMIDILMDLEEAFNVDIPEKKIGTSVCNIVNFIESQRPDLLDSSKESDLRESA